MSRLALVVGVYTLMPERIAASAAVVVGLIGAVIRRVLGGLALTRSRPTGLTAGRKA